MSLAGFTPMAVCNSDPMLECVANISEGRNASHLTSLRDACAEGLLDVHTDRDHHRSVFTLLGEESVRRLTRRAVELLDISNHIDGVHPRLGVVDVVPFVPLGPSSIDDAVRARQDFAEWAARELGIPCFLYGPAHGSLAVDRTLPEIRRHAWSATMPDIGPPRPHPTAGAICVGARSVLIAYNIWMRDPSGGDIVDRIACSLRSNAVRTLALRVGASFQVSMNLVDPASAGPADVHARVQELSAGTGAEIERCELVGLVPESVLTATPRDLWDTLDLAPETTIEYRMRAHG